ncbi:MAG: InlB B-repeat-containing protein [Spirochaetaceae bacterium]|nr:InlB B-repeat-containing protein [Spirochaetaceae bacterium]
MRRKPGRILAAGMAAAVMVLALSACTIVIETFYEVTYLGNGNSAGVVPVDGNVYTHGDAVQVLGNSGSLTKVGYIFNGWNSQGDGRGWSYLPGDLFTIGSSDVILYTQWKPWPAIADTWTMYFTRTADGSTGVRYWNLGTNNAFADDENGSGAWEIVGNGIRLRYDNNVSFPANTYFSGDISANCDEMGGNMSYGNTTVATWFAARGYISSAEIKAKALSYLAKPSGEPVK